MKTPEEILREAAALIEPPGAWVQHAYWGADEVGSDDPYTSYLPVPERATCFCLSGAIARVAGITPEQAFDCPAGLALRKVVGQPIWEFNDDEETGQVDAVAALRLAALSLERAA